MNKLLVLAVAVWLAVMLREGRQLVCVANPTMARSLCLVTSNGPFKVHDNVRIVYRDGRPVEFR